MWTSKSRIWTSKSRIWISKSGIRIWDFAVQLWDFEIQIRDLDVQIGSQILCVTIGASTLPFTYAHSKHQPLAQTKYLDLNSDGEAGHLCSAGPRAGAPDKCVRMFTVIRCRTVDGSCADRVSDGMQHPLRSVICAQQRKALESARREVSAPGIWSVRGHPEPRPPVNECYGLHGTQVFCMVPAGGNTTLSRAR